MSHIYVACVSVKTWDKGSGLTQIVFETDDAIKTVKDLIEAQGNALKMMHAREDQFKNATDCFFVSWQELESK